MTLEPRLLFGNSFSQIVNIDPALIRVLQFDLAFQASPSGPGSSIGDQGGSWVPLLQNEGYIPSGLVPELEKLLLRYGIAPTRVDMRKRPDEEVPRHSTIQLRPYQENLVKLALLKERGIIDAVPRSGKTRILTSILDRNPLKTLWVAPTKAIVHQTYAVLKQLLSAGPEEIQEVVGGWPKIQLDQHGDEVPGPALDRAVKLFDSWILVTTAATAAKAPKAFFDTRHILIQDESHHAIASEAGLYAQINGKADNIYYRYGATGTHFRSEERTEILMDALLSEVIGSVSVQELVDLNFLTPASVAFVPIDGPLLGPQSYHSAYQFGIELQQQRNDLIVWCAQALLSLGKRVLVLVKHVEHGARLAERIPGAVFVKGANVDFTDAEVQSAIQGFNSGAHNCLVGTSVLGEGIDLPAADALIYAKGGSARVTVTQDLFRVLTASPGKKRSIVIDFADRHQEMLRQQSVARGNIYAAEESFSVDVLGSPLDLTAWLSSHA